MKVCKQCKKTVPLDAFAKCKKTKDGHRASCKVCINAKYSKDYYKNNDLLRKYGISLDEYNTMLKEQKHKCKICGIHEKHCNRGLYVDHSHETGSVRALLCHHCNSGLGYFRDRQEFLLKAVDYLDEYEGI
jgi:hypothetical protein